MSKPMEALETVKRGVEEEGYYNPPSLNDVKGIYRYSCPNCGFSNTDSRLYYGLPCPRCLPYKQAVSLVKKYGEKIPVEAVYKALAGRNGVIGLCNRLEKLAGKGEIDEAVEVAKSIAARYGVEDGPNLLERVLDLCKSRLKRYEEIYRLHKEYEDAVSFFEKAIGSKPWGAQRTWIKRIVRGDSFSIIAPTGTGKTTFGAVMAVYFACKGKGKSLFIVPTTTLASNLSEKIDAIAKATGCNVTIVRRFGALRKEEREEADRRLMEGSFDIAIITSAYMTKKADEIADSLASRGIRLRLVFADDVDAVIKSAKSVDAILRLAGFKPEDLERAERYLELSRERNRLENRIMALSKDIRSRLREIRNIESKLSRIPVRIYRSAGKVDHKLKEILDEAVLNPYRLCSELSKGDSLLREAIKNMKARDAKDISDKINKYCSDIDDVRRVLDSYEERRRELIERLVGIKKELARLESEIAEARSRASTLIVSTATGRPRGRRVRLFRVLLGFEAGGGGDIGLREVVDSFVEAEKVYVEERFRDIKNPVFRVVVELVSKLRDGVLVYVPLDEGAEAAEELASLIESHVEGVKVRAVHAGISAREYERILNDFKDEKLNVLVGVATYYGLLVRGLDMPTRAKYAIFAGVPKHKFTSDVGDPHPARLLRLLSLLAQTAPPKDVSEAEARELEEIAAAARRYRARLARLVRETSPHRLREITEWAKRIIEEHRGLEQAYYESPDEFSEKIRSIVEGLKGGEGGAKGRVPGAQVLSLILSSFFLVKRALQRSYVWEALKSLDVGVTVENGRPVLLVPDAPTYVQASGRTSRLYAGGVTKGLSVVVVGPGERGVFKGLVSRLKPMIETEWKELRKERGEWLLDGGRLADIVREIEDERRRVKELREKGVRLEEDLVRSTLVIVESPNKARTIARFFGQPSIRILPGGLRVYEVATGDRILIVAASGGHVYDLAKSFYELAEDLALARIAEEEIGRVLGDLFGVLKISRNGALDFIPVYTTRKRCVPCGYQFVDEHVGGGSSDSLCGEDLCCPRKACHWGSVRDSLDTLEDLRRLAWEADEVMIGTDPDTEGEKIGWDVLLSLIPFNNNYVRLEFHEVTKKAIIHALENPRRFNLSLVDAQVVRRVEDRWIGFTLSPLLWCNFWPHYCTTLTSTVLGVPMRREELEGEAEERLTYAAYMDLRRCRTAAKGDSGERASTPNYNLSAGRVQTPTLKWIVNRTQMAKRRFNALEVNIYTPESLSEAVERLRESKELDVQPLLQLLIRPSRVDKAVELILGGSGRYSLAATRNSSKLDLCGLPSQPREISFELLRDVAEREGLDKCLEAAESRGEDEQHLLACMIREKYMPGEYSFNLDAEKAKRGPLGHSYFVVGEGQRYSIILDSRFVDDEVVKAYGDREKALLKNLDSIARNTSKTKVSKACSEVEKILPKSHEAVRDLAVKLDCSLDDTSSLAEIAAKLKERIKNLGVPSRAYIIVEDVYERTVEPPSPYTTDTLILDANRYLRLSASETMRLAQDLFEWGLITYHRTDSRRVSDKGIQVARELLSRLADKAGFRLEDVFRPRTWEEGGAHEAIRPARPIDPDELQRMIQEGELELEGFTGNHLRLYRLIYERFLASQMREAKVYYARVRIQLDDMLYNLSFEVEVPVRVGGQGGEIDPERGFTLVWNYGLNVAEALADAEPGKRYDMPVLVKRLRIPVAFLYTQGDVVQKMKAEGIGRPSTYAKIIDTLLSRGYVSSLDKPPGSLVANKRGIEACTYLNEKVARPEEHLGESLDPRIAEIFKTIPYIVSERKTRELQEAMNAIERRERDRRDVLLAVYGEIKDLAELIAHAEVEALRASAPINLEGGKSREGRWGSGWIADFVDCVVRGLVRRPVEGGEGG